jgi:hypothetical protein
MAFQKAHGLTIAQNGYVENMVVESLSSDPTVVEAGRCWFNTTQKLFKFSTLNGGGAVTIRAIKDKEDYDAFVASIQSQSADASGAHVIGYDGSVGGNGQLTITAGNIATALDSIVTNVDQALQDLDDLAGGGTGSIASVQAELDATQTGAGLGADGTFTPDGTTNYLTSATSLKDATKKLDTQSKANADAIISEASSRIAADALKVDLAGDTMGGNLDFAETYRVTGLAEPVDPSDAATKNYVDAFSAGLDVKESVRCATTANITLSGLQTIDGVNVASGDRVLVKSQTDASENGIYTAASGSWVRSTDTDGTPANEVSGGTFTFVEEGTTLADAGFVVQHVGNVVVGTDDMNWVQFSGAGQIIAGAGIKKQGNEIYLAFGAGIIELPGDEIGIDLLGTGGLWMTEDGVNPSTATDAEIGIKLDGTSLSLSGNGLRLSDTTINNLSGLHTELDNTQVGAGLGTGGSYNADGTASYIAAATSLFNADQLLDDQIKTNTDGLAAELIARGNADSALQSELDATQVGAGLGANGAYTAPASNYISGATSLKLADVALDTAIKSNEDDIAQEISDRSAAISAEQTARSNADSTLQGNINTLQAEVDATQVGAGLGTGGAYTANGSANYLSGVSSLYAADQALDVKLKELEDELDSAVGGGGTSLSSLQTELDATQVGAGLGTGGTYTANGLANYIDGATSLFNADQLLDTQVKANADALAAEISNRTTQGGNLQNELDATQAGAGLSSTGAYTVDTGSNFMKAANFTGAGFDANIHNATRLLDSAIQTEIVNRGIAISTVQGELDYTQAQLGLSASGEFDVDGTFIGTAATLDQALDALDSNLDRVDQGLSIVESDLSQGVADVVDSVSAGINNMIFTFVSSGAATQHSVVHNMGTQMVDVTVWVKDDDLKYRNDLTGITVTDNNTVTIDLTESREVRVVVRSAEDVNIDYVTLASQQT